MDPYFDLIMSIVYRMPKRDTKRGKLSMQLTSHITTNEKLLKSISEVRIPHDQKTQSLSIDQGFAVDIPNRDVFSEPIESEYDVNCYADGSKINEQVGAGIVVKSVNDDILDYTTSLSY